MIGDDNPLSRMTGDWLANVENELAKTRVLRAEMIAKGLPPDDLAAILDLLEETRRDVSASASGGASGSLEGTDVTQS